MEFTEEQIEEGKNFMKMKEFWQVNVSYNCDLLQVILDKYYNDCLNMYTAEIYEHQNSSRIIVRCNVCSNTELSSYDPFISHNNGKNHKKNLVERKDGIKNSIIDLPVVFKEMKDVENPFEKDTLESDLFETTHKIIGYQFLYREIKNKEELITCQLCARNYKKYEQMRRSAALRHMKSEYHQENYLREKFVEGSSTPKDERSRKSLIEDVIIREGKILHKIFTIDEKDPIEEPLSPRNRRKSDTKGESKDEIIINPKVPETTEEFLEVIHGHLKHLNKNGGDEIIKKLEKDLEATDLLISTANVLAQKICLFSENYDPDFKEPARKLLDYCEKLKLPRLKEYD